VPRRHQARHDQFAHITKTDKSNLQQNLLHSPKAAGR
jgi:hypothetical protein